MVFDFADFLKYSVPHGTEKKQTTSWLGGSYTATSIEAPTNYVRFVKRIVFLISKATDWASGIKISVSDTDTRIYHSKPELLSACSIAKDLTEAQTGVDYVYAVYEFDVPLKLLGSAGNTLDIERESESFTPEVVFTVHSWDVPESEV